MSYPAPVVTNGLQAVWDFRTATTSYSSSTVLSTGVGIRHATTKKLGVNTLPAGCNFSDPRFLLITASCTLTDWDLQCDSLLEIEISGSSTVVTINDAYFAPTILGPTTGSNQFYGFTIRSGATVNFNYCTFDGKRAQTNAGVAGPWGSAVIHIKEGATANASHCLFTGIPFDIIKLTNAFWYPTDCLFMSFGWNLNADADGVQQISGTCLYTRCLFDLTDGDAVDGYSAKARAHTLSMAAGQGTINAALFCTIDDRGGPSAQNGTPGAVNCIFWGWDECGTYYGTPYQPLIIADDHVNTATPYAIINGVWTNNVISIGNATWASMGGSYETTKRSAATIASWSNNIDAKTGATIQMPTFPADPAFTWKTLKVGAGGWLVGMDIAPDGTMVCRTDTYGGYIWDGAVGEWRQLCTKTTFPQFNINTPNASINGLYEIRIAPSNSNIIYMVWQGWVFKSIDKGVTWAQTAFGQQYNAMPANDNYRMNGSKMAIDPVNPNVVYVSGEGIGVFVTADGGATWSAAIAGIPTSTVGHTICFDPSSTVTGGKTTGIYITSWGNGTYHSTNSGASFSVMSGGPTNGVNCAITPAGRFFVVDDASIWKLVSGTWTRMETSGQYHAIAVDPFNSSRIVASQQSGHIDVSVDGGATWSGTCWYPTIVATDIAWLQDASGQGPTAFMSLGDIKFDPLVSGKLWFSTGTGMFWCSLPTGTIVWNTPYTLNSQTLGIEQLIGTCVISSVGASPLTTQWDRAVFRITNPDTFPTSCGPDNAAAIIAGWGIDWASSQPTFITGIFNWALGGQAVSSYSSDGGQTWTHMAVQPCNNGGTIAASTPTNWVVVDNATGAVKRTIDGGASWQTNKTTITWPYFTNRHPVCADRVTANCFYLYDGAGKIYRSTDGGLNWTERYSGTFGTQAAGYDRIRAVPMLGTTNTAGHLFFSMGGLSWNAPNQPSAGAYFLRSTDGGTTWTAVPNVLEVYAYGFGACAPGQQYPSIIILGWYSGVWGFWRSIDNCASWDNIGDGYPNGLFAAVSDLDGDKNTFGKVYVATSNGFVYGRDLSNVLAAGAGAFTHTGVTAILTKSGPPWYIRFRVRKV